MQNQSDAQWQRANRPFRQLDGKVPYILAAGNHDFGTTDFQNRYTQYNTYFKITDNPLNNPATGGIIKGTFAPNSWRTLTPRLRPRRPQDAHLQPRILSAASRASIGPTRSRGKPQYADYTALLLTHAFIDSGNSTLERPRRTSYPGITGEDGGDMWNKLVKPNGNFEMTFNGHFGGDGFGYRTT